MSTRLSVLASVVATALSVFTASSASAQGFQFFAELLGGNEVSATGQANAGDPDGSGTAAVMVQTNTLICYSITVRLINTPTPAHIHEAKAGVSGPIVITLTAPPSGNPGTSAGCVTADSTLIARIRTMPNLFYVNVHTGVFPGGAVRGQLF